MISLTFDDGLLNTYEVAFPIMEKYGFKGVAFIVTSMLPNRSKTSWCQATHKPTMALQEVRTLAKAGWEIGSHTVTHRQLNELPLRDAEKEIRKSKEQLESCGFEVTSFAYPYGNYPEKLSTTIKKQYTWARTASSLLINKPPYKRDALYSMEIINKPDSGVKIESWQIFAIHTISIPQIFEGWLNELRKQNVEVVTLKEVQP